ncbi:MAG: hypothetical protein ACI9VR_002189 [Cognaticolwellia sp.]|jgi:hypothetical protein
MQLLLLLSACQLREALDTAVEPRDCDERQLFYVDADGDGFGAEDQKIVACEQPDGSSEVAGDCDDTDPERVADCAPQPSELCDGAPPLSGAQVSYPDAEFPECPAELSAPSLFFQSAQAERYISVQQCTVERTCGDGQLSAVELSCVTQAAYGESGGSEVELTLADEQAIELLSDFAQVDPGLAWPLQVAVLLAVDGDDTWVSIYDADFALRLGWMQTSGALVPPADLLTAAGLDGIPWWGLLGVQDNLGICDWEDETQRLKPSGLDIALDTDGATVGVTVGANSWADLGDSYRVHTGMLQDSLDTGSDRNLLITGR